MKTLMRTVTLPDLLENAENLNPVLATDSWQTLMTFTRESARECFYLFIIYFLYPRS